MPTVAIFDPIVGGPLLDLSAIEEYANRLLGELLDALELDTAAVGATSYGGYFAVHGAVTIPERVTRIVEYSWPVGAPCEHVPLMARISGVPGVQSLMTRIPMGRRMVESSLRQFGLGRAIDSGAFDDVMLDWAHAILRHTDTLTNDVRSSPELFTPIRGQNPDVLFTDALLAELTMPVLLLWGEDDPNGGAMIAREFAPRLPDCELVVIAGAEHAPWLDDLDTCRDRTLSFLVEHP